MLLTRQTNYGFLKFDIVKTKLSFSFSKIPRIITILALILSLLLQNLIFNFSPVYAASSPWSQTNWAGGDGQTSWSDTTKFSSSSNVTTSTANQVTLTATSGWCDNSYCNTSWSNRRKITFNNTDANLGVTSENLVNFPVLVKLSSSNIDYSKTQANGEDIRFTDTDGADLAYEIEKWDETGTSYVWVKVPQIDINSNTDYIYLYYGNSAAADHQQATSAWDSNYKGVWHLKEDPSGSAPQAQDSTSSNHDGTSNGSMTSDDLITGQIDGSLDFDATDDYINASDPIVNVNSFSVEAWIKSNSLTQTEWEKSFISQRADGSAWTFYQNQISSFTFLVWNTSAAAFADITPTVSAGVWYHVVGVYNSSDQTVTVYLNGVSSGSPTTLTGTPQENTTNIRFGWGYTAARFWNGAIDEVRVSDTARSAAWIAASYKSETDAFNTFADEEPQVQTSGTLTSSIFDSGQRSDWGTLTYAATTPGNTSVSVKIRTGNQSDLSDATAFSSCSAISSGSDISSNSCITDTNRYIQYQLSLANTDSISTPTFTSFSQAFSLSTPVAPSSLSGSAASTTSITWSWTDNSSDESGFYVQDTDGNTKCTVSTANTTTCIEGSLSPNTSYTRKVVAYNGSGNSTASSNATASTLATAPTTSNVTGSPSTSSWTNNSSFTFTNSSGFGAGYVQYFRYAWDTSSTHTWTGSETQWTSGTLTKTATSDSNSWYLHLKGYNSSDVENGTLDLGPYYYDGTAPTSFDLDSPGDNSYTNSERPTFKWKATSDATAGLSKYVLEIDNPSLGSSQPSGDFTIDNIPTSRTTDYETNKYTIYYENFSDSDSTNNYIYVYTKSHSDWGTSENDGKLREGKVGWKVKAVDNAGNETSSSRALFVDRTNPKVELTQINDIPHSASSGQAFSSTDKTPTIFGKITDSLSGGDTSQTQDENGPKVASAPKEVNIKVEKKEGLTYKLVTLYKINMDNPYYTCDPDKTIDNSKQKCDKYLPFEYTSKENLELGMYKITLTGKDKADNSSEISFKLTITTLAQITTPEEKEAIEKDIKELPKEEQKTVKEELEITKPVELSALEKAGENITQAGKNVIQGTGNLITTVFTGIGKGIGFAFNSIGNGIAFIFDKTGQGFAFVFTKTGEGLAFVGNGIAIGFNNAGQVIGNMASAIGKGYNNLAQHAPGVTKNILLAVGNGVSTVGIGIGNGFNAVGTTTHNIGQGLNNTGNAIAQGFNNTKTFTQNGIANLAFTIGEKADDVSHGLGTAIIKIGYLFVPEPTKIYDVQVIVLSPTSAKVSWKTNHPANGKVNYGLDETYPFDIQTQKRITNHEFTLTDLKPDTQYYFEVMSQNRNYVYDANRKFRTPK